MNRLLTALGLGAALFLAPEALAQCNDQGSTAAGCAAGHPFSCAAAQTCYLTHAACVADSKCGGIGSLVACNTSGQSDGCSAATPFSCAASATCFAARADCTATSPCTSVVTVTSGSATICNATGVATDCPPGNPFSCSGTSTCYDTLAHCSADPLCPGGTKTPTGGCTTTLGWSPVLGLLLLLPWRRRPGRS